MRKCLGCCKSLVDVVLPYEYFRNDNDGKLFKPAWVCKQLNVYFTKPPHFGICYCGDDDDEDF